MKRKTIALVASLLICISLIGVGFAAWVISAPGQDETSGQIQVEAVTDKRLTVTAPASTEIENIYFGRPAQMNTTNAWLTSDGSAQQEKLSVSFTVTVSVDSSAGNLTDGSLDVVPTFKGDFLTVGAIKNAIDAKYIGTPTVAAVYTSGSGSTSLTYTVTITFAWGTAFGEINPYNYFNSKNITENVPDSSPEITWGDYAKAALTGIHALNEVTIPVVITANYETA